MRKRNRLFVSIALVGILYPWIGLSAQTNDEDEELKTLKKRIAKLETAYQKQIDELKKIVTEQQRQIEFLQRHLRLPIRLKNGKVVKDPFHLLSGDLPKQKEFVPPKEKAPKKAPKVIERDANTSIVRADLRWLKDNQNADGSWSSPGHKHDVATTSLAILSFLGSGHTHRFGTFKRSVTKGLNWLKKQQTEQGSMKVPGDAQAPLFDQALATMVLSESFAISRDFKLKKCAQRANDCLLLMRGDSGWGWSSRVKNGNTVMTSFAVLAFKAGKTGGLKIPKEAFSHATKFYEKVTGENGLAGYKKAGDGHSLSTRKGKGPIVPLFTSAACISRIFCGLKTSSNALSKSYLKLAEHKPETALNEPLYWYFGTYSMFQKGGPNWKQWSRQMKSVLYPAIEKSGSTKPQGVIGELCGRAGSTALSALTLEIYYRYTRQYPRATGK
ncbi:MAG: hypothetical protein P1V97_23015 [Planctomycetota bacterium]|nr:hypothetical protein [Planctomycetota bacterium]